MYSTATSNPPLPVAPETTAKLAVVNLLKQSPLLKGALVKFLTYDGDLDDDAEPDNLPKPFVRLLARPGPSSWFAAGQHQFTMQFQFEIGTDGTADAPLLSIWHAIRLALSPYAVAPGDGTQTIGALLREAGLVTWEFTEADYGVVRPKGQGTMRYQYGVGIVEAKILVST